MNVFLEVDAAMGRAEQLGMLRTHEVEGICERYKEPRDQLLHVLIESAKRGKLTWRRLADAMKTSAVDLPLIAQKIEREHCDCRQSSVRLLYTRKKLQKPAGSWRCSGE